MSYSSWPGRWQMEARSPAWEKVILVTREDSAGTLTSVGRLSCTVSVPWR